MQFPRALRAILVALLVSCLSEAGSQYFVSPNGNDEWSGTQAEAEGNSGPFRTLAEAQRAIRDLRAKGLLFGETRVTLAAGDYVVADGLRFGAGDLGTPEHPIVYAAAPDAKVVLRGDVIAEGWEQVADGICTAALPDAEPIAVFHGEETLPMARYPNRDASHPRSGGFLHVDSIERGADTLLLRLRGTGKLSAGAWDELAGATFHVWPEDGPHRRCRIVAGEREELGIRLSARSGIAEFRPDGHRRFAAEGVAPGTRGFLAGLPGELDAPGEWIVQDGRLRLLPPPGCEPAREVTTATAAPLVDIRGRDDKAGTLQFVGIEFRGAAGDLVCIRQGVSCSFERCRFALCGKAAIRVSQGHGLIVDGCDFRHVGAAAVQISRTERATVRNCWIAETGEQGDATGAVVLADATCRDARIEHNLIHDVPGPGIILNGTGHCCESNRLHHLGLEQWDGAGIMVWADYDGSSVVVRDNVVTDPGGFRRVSPTRYAYPDGMSGIAVVSGAGVVVAENFVLRAPRAALHLAGRGHTVENNLLVGGGTSLVEFADDAGPGLKLRRNVAQLLSARTAWIAGARLTRRGIAVDANLLWAGDDDPHVVQAGRRVPWDRWQESGFDQRSMLADPMFRAPQLDCYELLPQSLALRLGFVPLDSDAAGCQETPTRRTWPIDDEFWREQHILDALPGVLRPR